MSDKKMQFIDFHIHTFPDKIAEKTIPVLAKYADTIPCTNGTVSDTLEKFEEFGIDMCVCLNIATSLTAHTTLNNVCAKNNTLYAGKMVFFGSVNPAAPDALDELERIKSLGIKGIKLHPDYQNFTPIDNLLYDFYEKCSFLGLPIVFHAGWDCYSPNNIHSTPEMYKKIARNFPDLRIVLAHFGGLRLWNEVSENIPGLENVWLDTSMCASNNLSKELFMKIYSSHPSENILLGSDCPWEKPSESIKYIDQLPISDDKKGKIFFENALSFLNLN